MIHSHKLAIASALLFGFSMTASAGVPSGSALKKVITRPVRVSTPVVSTVTKPSTAPKTTVTTPPKVSTLSSFQLPTLTKPRPGGSEGCGPRPI